MADVSKALRQGYVYDGQYSRHRRRRHGRPPTDLDGHRFVACLQNHDQIGNRAQGERSGRLMNPGRLKVGAALLLTSAFVPLLFQGEEWAASSSFLFFTDHRDPKLAEAVRTGRRREFAAFGWKPEAVPDPQERGTFLRSRLNWSEPASEPHRSVLEWYRRLLWLRRQEPSLANGTLAGMATHFDEQARWLVVERGPLSVACNLASQPLEVPLRTQSHQVLLASAPLSDVVHSQVTLPADSAAILNLAKI